MPLLILSLICAHATCSAVPTSTEALLALLQLLQKTEVSWDFGTHCDNDVVERLCGEPCEKVGWMNPATDAQLLLSIRKCTGKLIRSIVVEDKAKYR